MSVCNPCTKMRPIIACSTLLNIGTIASIDTAVYVYIKNHTTGRLVRYDVTSGGAGLVRVALLDGQSYMQDHDYELWITLATDTDIEARETITIGAVEYTCVALEFVRLYSNADVLQTDEQTLKVA